MSHPPTVAGKSPLQPLLSDAVIVLRAPTQVWSGRGGDLGAEAIHGIYHGDVRHIRAVAVTCGGRIPESISVSAHDASRVSFGGLLRDLDDASPDPKVRLVRDRVVSDGVVSETLAVISHLEDSIDTELVLRLEPDFAPLQEVKSGRARRRPWTAVPDQAAHDPDASRLVVTAGDQSFTLIAPGGRIETDGDAAMVQWPVHVTARGRTEVSWSVSLEDPTLVVRGARSAAWGAASVMETELPVDRRLERWLRVALGDLDALRMALPQHPTDEFFAAGAPWFFTLFGRDSLWAARLALPVDTTIAASTLRVLARLQGERIDHATAEQPGKIMHELRGSPLEMPNEGIMLPPVYYGTVDATPLWVCLLADARDAGMPDDQVRELLPALRGALSWLTDFGASSRHGFIDYIDETGHGLANQGWKDSGDSIQWRDGALAQGPIALCEVQGYAYEAAVRGADLLDAFDEGRSGESSPGESRAAELRAWAAALKARFADAFWVETSEGRYPAIALDAEGHAVDTLTSNIGHLIGTGILDPDDEAHIAALLLGETMSSGFGIRTMSTEAAGYWPLSYHGGSVWVHDTAIAAHAMSRAGLHDEAGRVVEGLLAAAEGFDFRVPELHAGDPISETPTPTPYPAACRPQAWSAAAAIVCLEAVLAARRDGA